MKTNQHPRRAHAAFTIVEVMISMAVLTTVMALTLSTFLYGLKIMYKDNQRLATNASLRSFMAQISKETLDASYFYLFPYYTSLDGSVNLTTDPAVLEQDEDYTDSSYDKWVAHGDCLVLVTKTSQYRTTDIRQIRIYYRTGTTATATANVADLHDELPVRYYETADWGEGTEDDSNGHPISGLATELNSINLNSNPLLAGSRQLAPRSKGRARDDGTGFFPAFASESPTASVTNGFISINIEFINGSTVNSLLSSSSFNYTISPRR
jgi:type II secretory pathway pseudopilin PulG